MLPDFSMFDAIGTPVFVLRQDGAGDVVYAFLNRVGCRYLSCAPEDVVGKTAAQLFSGRAAETVYRRQREAWAAGVETTYEIPLPLGDETLWVRTRLTPQHDAGGQLTHFIGASQDISAEKQLEQSAAMTDAMISEMEDFVSFAAHDLRSPIANVRMLAELLREGFVDMGDGKLEMIGMIEDIAERALGLVSDVLAQSTTTQGDARTEPFAFGPMCDNILVTLDPARQHRVRVPCVSVEADMATMQIVVRNLIDNAFKHAGLDRVALRIEVAPAPGGMIAVTVSDNGRGFDDPALAFLSDGSARAKSGFGLVALRRLVRARGGRIIAARAGAGGGAEVRVELPGRLVEAAAGRVA